MFERLSGGAQRVVKIASDEAKRLGYKSVGTEHLLLALLKYDDGIVHRVFTAFQLTHEQIDLLLAEMPGANEYRGGFRTYTVQAKVALETSAELADEFNSSSINPEHILLALVPRDGDWRDRVVQATRAMVLLDRVGLRAQAIRFATREEVATHVSFVPGR